ncbi:pilus assembly PilX family protein [Thiobacillus sedimenti]|uniref:PilX N-terminal domain-containing pilus assembly protein n=1 Tax=Thiobacillus sedimenti TaxID=3110231 RepID=A0ABZ1CGR4_9PROT|nr:PilX N-terminal domain-containing pilus assembly protein [Thiobacillus sp. SCUT-2]WRS38389.1 PilX N-terminal domain-containing pilus assembly protein [Thiobacillus sp. SCUT-2]
MNTLKGIQAMHIQTSVTQRGAALITGLIFLVVLTLISLSAIKATSLEERMAGNARDQDVAFEAAEAGIRDAMKKLPTVSTQPALFVAGCSNGYCLNDPVTPVWTALTANNQWTSTKTAAYNGTLNFSGSGPALPQQPRYIIELLPGTVPAFGSTATIGKGNTSGAQLTPYRITAVGWGMTGQTQAMVQATVIY